jgi:hypothetical protein
MLHVNAACQTSKVTAWLTSPYDNYIGVKMFHIGSESDNRQSDGMRYLLLKAVTLLYFEVSWFWGIASKI